jgi:ribosomal-protein-alanine N-acetyltransferase
LYRRFGYEVAGRRKRYYKDTDEDAILMTLHGLDSWKVEKGKE